MHPFERREGNHGIEPVWFQQATGIVSTSPSAIPIPSWAGTVQALGTLENSGLTLNRSFRDSHPHTAVDLPDWGWSLVVPTLGRCQVCCQWEEMNWQRRASVNHAAGSHLGMISSFLWKEEPLGAIIKYLVVVQRLCVRLCGSGVLLVLTSWLEGQGIPRGGTRCVHNMQHQWLHWAVPVPVGPHTWHPAPNECNGNTDNDRIRKILSACWNYLEGKEYSAEGERVLTQSKLSILVQCRVTQKDLSNMCPF